MWAGGICKLACGSHDKRLTAYMLIDLVDIAPPLCHRSPGPIFSRRWRLKALAMVQDLSLFESLCDITIFAWTVSDQ